MLSDPHDVEDAVAGNASGARPQGRFDPFRRHAQRLALPGRLSRFRPRELAKLAAAPVGTSAGAQRGNDERKAWQREMDWRQALLTGDDIKIWDRFHVRGIPDYVVIGSDGKILADGESTVRDINQIRTAVLKAIH